MVVTDTDKNTDWRIEELLDHGAEVGVNGDVKLYHRTTLEKAQEIIGTGYMFGRENGLFFSTRRDGQASGYGDAVVGFEIPVSKLELDDMFDDEVHVRMPVPAREYIDMRDYMTGIVVDNPPYSGYQPRWYTKPRPGANRLCYPTKTKALLVFLDHNWQMVEEWGGPGRVEDPTAFEAINEEHGLLGRRRVDSLAKALWWVMPSGRPFCLDNMNLELLNATDAAAHGFRERGMRFALPDHVEEAKLAEREAEHYAELLDEDDPESIFAGLPDVPF